MFLLKKHDFQERNCIISSACQLLGKMLPISEKNAPKRPIEISCEKDFKNAPNFRNCAQSGNTELSLVLVCFSIFLLQFLHFYFTRR